MFNLQFFGAAQTVTGSRTLLTYKDQTFFLDCGLFQGPKEIRQKNWEPQGLSNKIDGVVLTHAHIDHSGMLPLLCRSGFRGPIYCSPATADLCKILLPDAAKLQEEDAFYANRSKHSKHDPALPLYTQRDAEECLKLLNPVPYHQWFQLAPGLTCRFKRSAHILGSAFIEIHADLPGGPSKLLLTGDLGNNRSLILKEAEEVEGGDTLVIESTYGDRAVPKYDILEELRKVISRVITRGGTLIIPAFSVGRTQEMLFMIQRLLDDRRIPQVPVYLDSPLSQKATTIYRTFENELKDEIKGEQWTSVSRSINYRAVESADDSMLLCMDTSPKIVISAAGMLNGGRVLHHLRTKLPDPKSCVLFVGYQVPGTKGYLLKNAIGTIRIHHQNISVEAEVVSLESLSAHADSNELVEWVRRLKLKPKRIFLNHGEIPALQALQYRLREELGLNAIIAKEGEVYDLSKTDV